MTTTGSGFRAVSACNGASVAFPVPFAFIVAAELKVYLLDAADEVPSPAKLLVLGSNYTISGDRRAGTAQVNTTIAYPAGKYLLRVRATARTQDADFVPGSPVQAEAIETALDRLALVDEEQDGAIGRALVVPDGESGLIIPALNARKGKSLRFNLTTGLPEPFDPAADLLLPNFSFAVNTGAAGSTAQLAVSGTYPNMLLTFTVPQGVQGNSGALSNGTFGDIVVTGGGATLTIGNRAATFAKMQAVGSQVILGRNSAGSGDIEPLGAGTVKTILGLENCNNTSDANKPVSTAQAAAIAAGRVLAQAADQTGSFSLGGATTTEVSYTYTGTGGHTATVLDTLPVGAMVTVNNDGTGNLATAGSGVTITNMAAGNTTAFNLPPKSSCTFFKKASGKVFAFPTKTV